MEIKSLPHYWLIHDSGLSHIFFKAKFVPIASNGIQLEHPGWRLRNPSVLCTAKSRNWLGDPSGIMAMVSTSLIHPMAAICTAKSQLTIASELADFDNLWKVKQSISKLGIIFYPVCSCSFQIILFYDCLIIYSTLLWWQLINYLSFGLNYLVISF